MFRLALALLLSLALPAHAGQVQVAAAANLAGPIQKIAAAFQRDTGHAAIVALGSTGKFHAQVRNGAPFEVLLAADAETPRRLEAEGLARQNTRFTYAIGRLVLWSAQPGVVDANADVLRQPARGILAIADPRVSPYGAAAVETLKNLGLLPAWERRFAHAENIAQAYQFAATGNAPLAFVALSQVTAPPPNPPPAGEGLRVVRGSGWIVPADLHAPIRQDAVLLNPGAANPVATAFLAYLRSDAARALLRAAGYSV
jgi:molybdate transport system substrate-binding protein